MHEIKLTAQTVSLPKLEDLLKQNLEYDIALKLHADGGKRGMDPAVLVALIGVAGTTITALINGLFMVMEKARSSKLSIKTSEGRTYEIPINTSPTKLSELVDAIENKNIMSINLEK